MNSAVRRRLLHLIGADDRVAVPPHHCRHPNRIEWDRTHTGEPGPTAQRRNKPQQPGATTTGSAREHHRSRSDRASRLHTCTHSDARSPRPPTADRPAAGGGSAASSTDTTVGATYSNSFCADDSEAAVHRSHPAKPAATVDDRRTPPDYQMTCPSDGRRGAARPCEHQGGGVAVAAFGLTASSIKRGILNTALQ